MPAYSMDDITCAFRAMEIPYRVEQPGTLNASVVVGRTHFAPAVTETGQAADGIDSCDEHDRHEWHRYLPDAVKRAMKAERSARRGGGPGSIPGTPATERPDTTRCPAVSVLRTVVVGKPPRCGLRANRGGPGRQGRATPATRPAGRSNTTNAPAKKRPPRAANRPQRRQHTTSGPAPSLAAAPRHPWSTRDRAPGPTAR